MGVIEVRDLTFSYPDPRPVLRGCDLELEETETLGLVGPNGAGKTTLFLLLAGVLRGIEGTIEVLGKDATDPELRGRVGVVFQHVEDQLFSTTVRDDVAFGPLNLGIAPEEAQQRVVEALDAVGLSGFEDRIPHHLSGGEKRRVALAAVLSMRPDVFLFDEPSSDLDPRARRELIELIQALPQPQIIATHDLEMLVEVADRVAILHDGRIQASGDPLGILADAELMAAHQLAVPPGIAAIQRLRGMGEGSG